MEAIKSINYYNFITMNHIQKLYCYDKIYTGDNMKKRIINFIITLLIGALIYYVTLPALNLNNMGFYMYIFSLLFIYGVLDVISFTKAPQLLRNGKLLTKGETSPILLFLIGTIVIVFITINVVNFFCSPLFNAKSYQTRIVVDEGGNFTDDIEEVNFNQLPLLDRTSSEVLGDRVMGQMMFYQAKAIG